MKICLGFSSKRSWKRYTNITITELLSHCVYRLSSFSRKAHNSIDQCSWRGSLPVLFDVDVPLPFEILLLVVVREERVYVVRASSSYPSGRVLDRRRVALYFRLGRVGTDHVIHLVHRHAHAARLLHVLQARHDFPLKKVLTQISRSPKQNYTGLRIYDCD